MGSLAQIPCSPGASSRIAICSSSCSVAYCGYNLPLAGKRHLGNFITYYTTGDNKPLEVPDGAEEARHTMRVVVPTDDVSLHFAVDEIPDFCCFVRVDQENGSFSQEFRTEANERATINNLKEGIYLINIIHRVTSQGGRIARYVPMVYLAPAAKEDTAGGSYETARNVGDLSGERSIEINEYLQAVKERNWDGSFTGSNIALDQADWFRFTTGMSGLLKVSFNPSAILDSSQVVTSVGYATEFSQGPIAIPETGYPITPGAHYIVAEARPSMVDSEYGFKYNLRISFEPA